MGCSDDSPTGWGPYQVGSREYLWQDDVRGRWVWPRIWYPAHPRGDGERAAYLNLGIIDMRGQACDEASADTLPNVAIQRR